MKKGFIIGLLASTTLFSTAIAFADSENHIVVNGNEINAEVQMINSHVYIPLRTISESLGATVGWDDQSRTATILLNGKNVSVQEGNNAVNTNSKLFVPLRFIAESVGVKIDWDSYKHIAYIGNTPSGIMSSSSNSETTNNAENTSNELQQRFDDVIKNDTRNIGIEANIRENSSTLTFDLTDVSGDKSKADVFRVLLQVADKLKDKDYTTVQLAFRGNPKFKLTGAYFKQLGNEYSWQNPAYTTRTFPYNLLNNDASAAYTQPLGGFLYVLSKEVDDFGDFQNRWWLSDLAKLSK
jgi:hypothetical protein